MEVFSKPAILVVIQVALRCSIKILGTTVAAIVMLPVQHVQAHQVDPVVRV
jgi:hypothetical protein